MGALAVIVGIVAVVSVLTDMINTLVTTQTSQSKWWLSKRLTQIVWAAFSTVGARLPDEDRRDRVLSAFGPTLVFTLLTVWVAQQIVGFALIWWGLGGVDGVDSFADDLYYSGVVFFTVGFGEVVPASDAPRFGALVEAFAGVLSTALVIGYLPSLYGAYSERERKLMTLDDGSEERITPTNLVKAWAPDADVNALIAKFESWEDWVAGVIETHTTFPMLRYFRSHHHGQNWVTALGLVSDAALHCQMIKGANNRAPYFMLRRSIRLFQELTADDEMHVARYRQELDQAYAQADGQLFVELYDQLTAHGFELVPFEEARQTMADFRREFDARMEFLIDTLHAPRGFWGHSIRSGLVPISTEQVVMDRDEASPSH